MRRLPVWAVFLAAGAMLTGAYLWAPGLQGSAPLFNLLGLTPVLAIVAGVRRYAPASKGPWWWFAGGVALFWLGDLYTYSYPKLIGHEVPFPSPGDAAYVAVYPALMIGLLLLVRRRNPESDRAGVIDSVIMTLGLSLLSWIALIAPYLHDGSLGLLGKLTSVAYPLGDVLLLSAAIRLSVDAGRRQASFYLLAASIVALLFTDFFYGLATLHGTFDLQLGYDVGWIAFYLLFGAAALHPSMRRLQDPVAGHESRLTPVRLALLTAASLVAPAIELLSRQTSDLQVVIAASAVVFGFVVARMAGLVLAQQRSAERERTLGGAGSALVSAATREQIGMAGEDAARQLAGEGASVFVVRGEMAYSAGTGWPLPAPAARALSEAAGDAIVTLHEATCLALHLPLGRRRALIHALGTRDGLASLLVVAGSAVDQSGVRRALHALGIQIELAVESAALAEEIHRRAGEDRLSALFQNSNDLIAVLGAGGEVIYQSPSVERVLGEASIAKLLPAGMLEAVTAGQTAVVECVLAGREFEVQLTNLLDDEGVRGIVLNGRDVSERRAFERQLEHQAFHDPVTGLANRALFNERVRHAVARARREPAGVAVVFLDLDDFKTINDGLGHAAGDAVLVEVGKRIATSVRAVDTAARFGGDEFAILLEDVDGAQVAADGAERVLDALAEPFAVDGHELAVRASVGISFAEAGDAGELVRDADAAMYIAKREGGGGYRLFEPAMHERVLARLELRADLQQAVAAGQLELHYQPVVKLADGGVSGLEALLRWHHPRRGLLGPDTFIPLAEETGLIIEIGRWVLHEGCRRAVEIQAEAGETLTMAINLSVKQLQHAAIVDDVRDALDASGLDPARLTLEVTESVMMTDPDTVVERLHELKALGVRLAIANAVVALGATLALDVVAEGVEHADQWERLRELGCDLGQGFLFARPMTMDATLAYLRDQRTPVGVPDRTCPDF